MAENEKGPWDDYELGSAIIDHAAPNLIPSDDPKAVEQLGRQARPAIGEMAEAVTAMARIIDVCNRDHPELIEKLERLARSQQPDAE